MANLLLSFVLGLLSFLINLVLLPINAVLNSVLPSGTLSDIATMIDRFWSLVNNYFNFVISYTGLDGTWVGIICLELSLIITIPLLVHPIKLIADWWETLV